MGNSETKLEEHISDEEVKLYVIELFQNVSKYNPREKADMTQIGLLVRRFMEIFINEKLPIFKKYVDDYINGLTVGATAKLLSYNITDSDRDSQITDFMNYLAFVRDVHISA